MDVKSAFMSGMQGYQSAVNSVSSASRAINQPEADSLTSNLVQLKQAELSGQASVRVMDAADEMLGTVIDIRV
jgi:flagellar hook-associated protein FlgK